MFTSNTQIGLILDILCIRLMLVPLVPKDFGN